MDPAFAVILLCLGAGHLCARHGIIPKESSDAFNRYVIYVCLPAIVLRLIPKLVWQPSLLVLAAVPWLLTLTGAAAVLGAARAFGLGRQETGALLLCIPLGNTSFLGFPMVSALISPDAVRYALLYDQLGSFLALSTYGLLVVARYSGEGEPTLRSVLLRVVKFPPFVALVLATVPVPHPEALDTVLGKIGDTLVPIAMFAVGLRLELRVPRRRGLFAFGLAMKMAVFPALAWVVVRAVGAPAVVGRVAVLEAGMPPMITAGAMAIMAGFAPELAAALVGYGILGSLATLPLLASWTR